DVENIYSLAKVYYLIQDVLGKHSVPGVKYYIAGAPLVFGVVADMMPKDMSTMVPIALAIILAVLLVSFRSLRGIVIPTITVVLAVIWSLGLMASLGIPFTVTTNILPIVLLAVGSAYSIHLLNRFYEDAANVDNGGDRRKIVVTSVSKVGVAVFMAGVTTIAGFSSLATADLTPIKHFGAFSAVGVAVALLLTLTLTPAILTIWKAPKNRNLKAHGNPGEKTDWVSRIMRRWANLVIAHPKVIVFSLTILVVASLSLMSRNYFEGGMMSNFKKNNPIYVSDRFLAKNLTGTTNINLLFEFRDRILLEDENARNDFLKRIDGFAESWKQWLQKTPEKSNPRFSKLEELLRKEGKGLPGGLDTVVERIRLIRNMLDEEYMLEVASTGEESSDEMNGEFSSESGDGDTGELDELDGDDGELDGLSETGSEEDDLSQPAGAFADLSKEQIAGLKDIIQRLEVGEENWEEVGKAVLRLREDKASPSGLRMQHDLNYLQDFLALDIKQPTVLHKLEQLYAYLKGLESPEVVIDGRVYPPTGLVVSPVDMVSKFYRVFYHDDNYAFNKLPDVAADGFEDERLTDRTIIGVLLNQALSSNRDDFEAMITPNLKEFQMQAMIRDDSGKTVDAYVETALDKVAQLFPKNDPYIKTVRVGGQAPTSVQMTRLIGKSQLRSIVLSFLFVFVVTFFIFRSALGGLYSLIPLGFTVILNFGLLALLGGQITMPIMLVASIAIGTGVDYTIHFLERMKIQLREGDTLHEAYIATVLTSGKAIMLNALAVALGFLVLLASRFVPPTMMGVLMAATMMFSSLGALTLLPALIFLTKPSFLEKSKLGK
ncbi:MAG: MMPL family transporter, partial [Proteobacteria bacterium]|nr:MMPL family transporter [Pseudomonadota bacterium]